MNTDNIDIVQVLVLNGVNPVLANAVEGAITYIAQVKNYDTLCEMAQYIQNAIKDEHEWVMRDR